MEIVKLNEIAELLVDIRDLLQINSTPWLTIKRAGTYTGLGRSSISNIVHSGKIPIYRPTDSKKRILLKKDDLDRFLSKKKQSERGRPRSLDIRPETSPPAKPIKEEVL